MESNGKGDPLPLEERHGSNGRHHRVKNGEDHGKCTKSVSSARDDLIVYNSPQCMNLVECN